MFTIPAAAFDPLRVLTILIHFPIRLTAAGISPGVAGIQFERRIKDLDGVFDILLLVVILQIAKPLQVEVVCASRFGAVRL